MVNHVIFDMDGTLIDSAKMVISRYVETFENFGVSIPEPAELHSLVGPSARMSMNKYLGSERTDEGIAFYRELAKRDGTRGLAAFDGVAEMLSALTRKGYALSVATSKPENEASIILENLNFLDYFQVVSGSNDQLGIHTKTEVIAEAISRLGNPVPKNTLMVGDRIFDIEGANNLCIPSIFVTWGGAPLLEGKNANGIVDSPEQLIAEIEKY